jgi:hypothetical protein
MDRGAWSVLILELLLAANRIAFAGSGASPIRPEAKIGV